MIGRPALRITKNRQAYIHACGITRSVNHVMGSAIQLIQQVSPFCSFTEQVAYGREIEHLQHLWAALLEELGLNAIGSSYMAEPKGQREVPGTPRHHTM